MHRASLLALLEFHKPFDDIERQMLGRFRHFVALEPRCFERSLVQGHVTGSAWVVDASGTQVLLLHHRKLDRWLQPGGHCDGDPDVLQVALREAHEESGLSSLVAVDSQIFDVDIHWIPARSDEEGHWHYDARFLLRAPAGAKLRINSESNAARWMPIEEALSLPEDSLRRMAHKARGLFPSHDS